ncbi:hypothetical protein AGOR_G00205540 [Albula goreensis]|uniref:Uncharacterized protein n=1 Tax=Albula goreensis TaxID=1534307 RepID=A0A8T3CQS9_9TELE|nr:hypothetical protein AGOR_G00205540 [Albula goreensis]
MRGGRTIGKGVPQQQGAGHHEPRLHIPVEQQPAGGGVGQLRLSPSRPALPTPPRQLCLLPRATSGESLTPPFHGHTRLHRDASWAVPS